MLDKNEIIRSFREAKDKPKQIRILADLNNCMPHDIQSVLIEAGYTKQEVRSKAPKGKPAQPAAKRGKVQGAIAALKEEIKALCERESEIPQLVEALQLEYEQIAGKRRAIECAIAALTDAFPGGGRDGLR